ncbi:hypothetical protein pdam_00010032 [Pocillopora damicornis]|uniref:Uncharacterized protein n=1 Tax=Pocillopora damicornis TaxID=46731 RepID=A0A3M6T514_POCDA|nr:hypothetical protein pdam_00010032 [Pocillopora damicornis]
MIEKVNSQSSSKDDASRSLWVFGYGSLIWKPDFPFEYCVVGHIDGFVRRFYQGSTWHRGDSEKSGNLGGGKTASPEQIASQIAYAKGNSGLNVEYLVRLADFMREKVPDYDERHLFDLEKLVKKELGLSTDVYTSWTQLKYNLTSRG